MGNSVEPHKFTKKELEKILRYCKGKTLGQVDKKNVFSKTITNPKITGIAGDVIEQSVFGYPADSNQRPDLLVDDTLVELKTTGLIKKGNELIAKEPCSITAVSIGKIEEQNFENSFFWEKAEHILFVYYEYVKKNGRPVVASEYANFKIRDYSFNIFSDEDKIKLKADWEKIHNFLKEIKDTCTPDEAVKKYPLLSSALRKDLLLLDTAPKYPHPPRFRFKRSFVTEIYKKRSRSEDRITNFNSFAEIDEKCHDLTELYSGKTIKQLANELNIHGFKLDNKAICEKILLKMFDSTAKSFSKIELFNKIGLIVKTVVHTTSGNRTEDTKLYQINFTEYDKNYFLADSTENDNSSDSLAFEDSTIYEYFAQHQFLIPCFEEPSTDAPLEDNKFIGFKRIYFTDEFISTEVYRTWTEITDLIQNKKLKIEKIYLKNGKLRYTPKTKIPMEAPNFPKSETNVVFVRGGAENSSKKNEEVNGLKMIRQFIWIKGSFLSSYVKDFSFL